MNYQESLNENLQKYIHHFKQRFISFLEFSLFNHQLLIKIEYFIARFE